MASTVLEHESALRGIRRPGLFQTLTSRPCLRRTTSQTRKYLGFSGEEERVETRKDGLQVVRDGRNGAPGRQIAPSAAPADVDASLAELARAVDHDLSTPDLAPSTERAYAHDWADFAAFCARHGLDELPAAPQTLALYLKSLETARSRAPSAYRRQPPAERIYIGPIGLALPTLRRRLAAIAVRHTAAGQETPTDHPLVRRMLRRYARTRGTAAKKKEPLTVERLPAIVAAMPDDLAALRDRALILLGYAGAFRRSECAAKSPATPAAAARRRRTRATSDGSTLFAVRRPRRSNVRKTGPSVPTTSSHCSSAATAQSSARSIGSRGA